MADAVSSERQTLVEIAAYHNDAVDALAYYFRARYREMDSRLFPYDSSEFERLLLKRIEETEFRSSFAILVLVEAAFRVDYSTRVQELRSDPLSKAFRAMDETTKSRPRFDDVLKLWTSHHPEVKGLIGELRTSLKFRHWLAHGRYWQRPGARGLDYLSVYLLANSITSTFPFLPPV